MVSGHTSTSPARILPKSPAPTTIRGGPRVFNPAAGRPPPRAGGGGRGGPPGGGLITPAPFLIGGGAPHFGKIRAGDVLVCPETTAQWSVVFPSLGALIADNGSLLSHPAIIAREYGIPAVVAAAGATERLRDGQLVEVDGTAGVVRVLDADGGVVR
nr:PEP-utilizing enzyme [Nocardia brasiliensis]